MFKVIIKETIQSIYTRYYLLDVIEKEKIYFVILENNYIETGSIWDNEIYRVFICLNFKKRVRKSTDGFVRRESLSRVFYNIY